MYEAAHHGRTFVIEPDNPDVGVYLYVYEGGRCIRDYLQNDITTCIEVALEDYGVPRDAWKKTAQSKRTADSGE